MNKSTGIVNGVLGTFILGLTLAVGTAPAHATLVSFNFTYTPFHPGIGTDNLTLDVTGFLDDSQITGVGTEFVTLDHLDVVITGRGTSQTAHFANNETGIYPGNPRPRRHAGLQRVPYFVQFRSGVLHAGLDGLQRNAGIGIDGLSFKTLSPNGPHSFVGFGSAGQSDFPGEVGVWDQGKLVQPIDTTLTVVNPGA